MHHLTWKLQLLHNMMLRYTCGVEETKDPASFLAANGTPG